MSATGPAPYEVRLRSRRVQRELDSLPQSDFPRIFAAIEALAAVPRPLGSVHLEDNIFRLRVGRFRVIYRVDDETRTVEIGGVRRRSEGTYRRIRELF